jgi:electron transfer flavoprotein beta subunit
MPPVLRRISASTTLRHTGYEPMKIAVCVKQVPARESALRVTDSGKSLDTSGLSYEMNEPDAYALEETLQLKESLGGEAIVICAGPQHAAQTIREALAKGADRAIHVETGEAALADSFETASLLAKGLESEKPDLILTGLQSDDAGYGQTGVILAELLGYSHATIVMEVAPVAGGVRVKRELEDGWFQYVTLPFPAVLTIQSGIKKLRYATLMGIKKAKTKEVRTIPAAQFASHARAVITIERLYAPEKAKQSQIFSGDPSSAARQLVEKLKIEARAL